MCHISLWFVKNSFCCCCFEPINSEYVWLSCRNNSLRIQNDLYEIQSVKCHENRKKTCFLCYSRWGRWIRLNTIRADAELELFDRNCQTLKTFTVQVKYKLKNLYGFCLDWELLPQLQHFSFWLIQSNTKYLLHGAALFSTNSLLRYLASNAVANQGSYSVRLASVFLTACFSSICC